MGVEIERKFLVKALPENPERFPYHEITQGYLSRSPAVRVRREVMHAAGGPEASSSVAEAPATEYYMTYKGLRTEGSLAQEEYNLPLTPEAYEHLLEKADGVVITKRRYLIPLTAADCAAVPNASAEELRTWIAGGEAKIELDVFEGAHDGLVIAEVEFPSEALATAWQPVTWFGREITGDRRYSNAALAQKPGLPEE